MVPASAGGVTDVVARIAADYLSTQLKQQFVVENRTGAGGNIATDAVAKASPDGYTLGLVASGNVVINPYIYMAMPFDAQTDLIPVASIAEAPQVIAVTGCAGVAAELIALAKAKPNSLSYATAGAARACILPATSSRGLPGSRSRTPYRGAVPAVTDVVAGYVQSHPVSAGPIMGFVRRVTAVPAAASPRRLRHFPDVPTTAEAGCPAMR